MGGFSVCLVSEGAVRLPVYVDIQKWEVSFIFYFHGELYVVVHSIQVVKKVREFFFPMWPDDESIINISVPASWLVCGLFYSCL